MSKDLNHARSDFRYYARADETGYDEGLASFSSELRKAIEMIRTRPEPYGVGPQTVVKPPSPIMQSVDPSQMGAIQNYAPCSVNAPAGYRGGNCRIQIWRSVPISPPTTLSLP